MSLPGAHVPILTFPPWLVSSDDIEPDLPTMKTCHRMQVLVECGRRYVLHLQDDCGNGAEQ
jgi:hypothetical protein